ncbi:hypothetical protein ACWC6I_09295 [Streptomyces sp. NPDC001414]
MVEHGVKGSIVNVGSMWAHQAVAATPSSAYSMAKAGLHSSPSTLAWSWRRTASVSTPSPRPSYAHALRRQGRPRPRLPARTPGRNAARRALGRCRPPRPTSASGSPCSTTAPWPATWSSTTRRRRAPAVLALARRRGR